MDHIVKVLFSEAKYTYDCNKDYIPIIMKRKYKADGWLGAMIATKLYIDFEKYDFNNSYERLVKEIGARGKAEKGKQDLTLKFGKY